MADRKLLLICSNTERSFLNSDAGSELSLLRVVAAVRRQTESHN